ncbi:MAG: hypothetical protein RJA99_256 [Pseudomonadota bacterium]|jgi:diguanylate cyclase (GGDEF)-like protein
MLLLFDVRTLFFVGALTALACTGMLWTSRALHGPSREGLVWAAGSQAAFGLAMGLLALRGGLPDLLTVGVASVLGTGAAAFAYESVRRLVRARPMPGLAWGTLGALVLFHAAFGNALDAEHVTVRLQLNSIVHAAFAFAALPLIQRALASGSDAAVPLRWLLGVTVVFAVGQLSRTGLTIVLGERMSVTGIVEGPVQMLMPTVFALGPMVWSMILIGLVNGRLSAELWRLATVDALTGVRTRRSFLEGARRVLDRGGRPVLLLLDLDRFKQINDRFGHASGDRVLARFAKLLRDTSPEGTLVGRYGGEEFCLLLPDASPEAGRLHAQRLCDAVRAVAFGLATETPVTVSIGVASTPDGATLEELLLAADRRLYRAKAEGRDRVVAEDAPSAPETVPWSSLQLDAADGPPSERERRLMS